MTTEKQEVAPLCQIPPGLWYCQTRKHFPESALYDNSTDATTTLQPNLNSMTKQIQRKFESFQNIFRLDGKSCDHSLNAKSLKFRFVSEQ